VEEYLDVENSLLENNEKLNINFDLFEED